MRGLQETLLTLLIDEWKLIACKIGNNAKHIFQLLNEFIAIHLWNMDPIHGVYGNVMRNNELKHESYSVEHEHELN